MEGQLPGTSPVQEYESGPTAGSMGVAVSRRVLSAVCRWRTASGALPRRVSASEAYVCPSCHSGLPASATCKILTLARNPPAEGPSAFRSLSRARHQT